MDGLRLVLNVIWLVLVGWWLALMYLLAGLIACLLIVTIPFGIASFRLAGFAAVPFGRTTVPAPGVLRRVLCRFSIRERFSDEVRDLPPR
jgi:uncharacterized membrane protein YccF (DUF307 family)